MTHYELLDQLNSTHTAFHLAALGSTLIVTEEAQPIIRMTKARYGRFAIDFSQTADGSPQQLAESIYQLTKAMTRQLITESFESIRSYSEKSRQENIFKQQPWFHFARIIRNAYNHDFHIVFRKYDFSILPVEYITHAERPEVLQVDSTMNGLPVDIVNRPNQKGRRFFQFTYEHALDLFYEMRAFAESLS